MLSYKILSRFVLFFIFSLTLCFLSAESKMIVLGVDGMDPNLLQQYMNEGKMPHFKKFIQKGDFKPLITSYPPQSPVAWSNVAIGANPGKHGIFDFIHRDPDTMIPFLSITETLGSDKVLKFGSWQIPLSGGSVRNLRGGKPFWEHLCEHHIDATINQIPGNYPAQCPCESSQLKILTGMGTPDLLGTQGTFTFYTTEKSSLKETIGGGEIRLVQLKEGLVDATIDGPPHPYKTEDVENLLQVPFQVWVDDSHPVAKIMIQDQEIFLKEGEFSQWVPITFDILGPLQSISGICRFYLKETHPEFKLYVSPININPENPAVPISFPNDYAKELYDSIGYFYTQNMPPDTKALEHGIFSDQEYFEQTKLVFAEEKKRLFLEIDHNQAPLLFHYFSVIDQTSHTFWRTIDPEHPLYTSELNRKSGHVIEYFYREMDQVLGELLEKVSPETQIMIMSDHGFSPFRWGVNLNTILLNKGLISLQDPTRQGQYEFFANVNWAKTKAYNLGINAIYINLLGRESHGAVWDYEYEKVRDEIIAMLLAYQDPRTGKHPIQNVSKREEIYQGEYLDKAPDLIVGFTHGYRASWETILGKMPFEEVIDNTSPWSGDHCIFFDLVPGVLISNRKIDKEKPALIDIAPTILEFFKIKDHQDMDGNNIYKTKDNSLNH